jgi:hypothetical protein
VDVTKCKKPQEVADSSNLDDVCFVRSVHLDECKFLITNKCHVRHSGSFEICRLTQLFYNYCCFREGKELEALETGGNDIVNSIFEAKSLDEYRKLGPDLTPI